MQSQANQQAAQAKSQGAMQEEQMKTKGEAEILQLKAQLDMQKLEAEKQIEAEMMKMKFEFDMQLKQLETKGLSSREQTKEDRKDKRTEIQATQQSQLIAQRKQNSAPRTFDSSAKTPFDKMKSAGGGFFGRMPDSAPATPTMMQQPPQVPPQAPPQPQTGLPPGEPSPQQDGQMLDALMSKMQGGKNV